MKMRKLLAMALSLFLPLCFLPGALAEGEPNALLEEDVHLTDSIRDTLGAGGLTDTRKMVAEDAGITVTLDECIADSNHIRVAFHVSGVIIPDDERPAFTGIRVEVPGLENDGEPATAGFFNWVEDNRILWNDENGDMTYFFAAYTDQEDFTFEGKQITVMLEKLVYDRYGDDDETIADGKWVFTWDLRCTNQQRSLMGLNLEIPQTKAVLTDVTIGPMHMTANLVVPGYFDGESPYITGFILKDGNEIYHMMESISTSPEDRKKATVYHAYFYNRVIEPDQVASLLFGDRSWGYGETVTVDLP